MYEDDGRTWTLERALAATEAITAIPRAAMLGKYRGPDTVWARHICWYVLREYGRWHLQRIADVFGCDHSSVHHGHRRVSRTIAASSVDRKVVEAVLACSVDADTLPALHATAIAAVREAEAVLYRLRAVADDVEARLRHRAAS